MERFHSHAVVGCFVRLHAFHNRRADKTNERPLGKDNKISARRRLSSARVQCVADEQKDPNTHIIYMLRIHSILHRDKQNQRWIRENLDSRERKLEREYYD
jgi:hypothetical protein